MPFATINPKSAAMLQNRLRYLRYSHGGVASGRHQKENPEPGRGANLGKGVTLDHINMNYLINHRTMICGSRVTCIEQARAIQRATGLDQLVGMQQFGSIQHQKVMKSLALSCAPAVLATSLV
jgi:hypothetical protein